jgi:hypothetical protein
MGLGVKRGRNPDNAKDDSFDRLVAKTLSPKQVQIGVRHVLCPTAVERRDNPDESSVERRGNPDESSVERRGDPDELAAFPTPSTSSLPALVMHSCLGPEKKGGGGKGKLSKEGPQTRGCVSVSCI